MSDILTAYPASGHNAGVSECDALVWRSRLPGVPDELWDTVNALVSAEHQRAFFRGFRLGYQLFSSAAMDSRYSS